MKEPVLIEEKPLCKGVRVEVIQRTYEFEGMRFVRDTVLFGSSVAVVPLKAGGRVVLIKQFRAPINGWVLEIPAGRVEIGESPEEAAVRELEEEVGYRPRKLVKVASIYTTPGYSDEILHLYIALNLEEVRRHPEIGELIEVVEMGVDEALEAVLGGGVADSKTLLGLLLVKRFITQ